MSFSSQILGYVCDALKNKGSSELNLAQMEFEQADWWKKSAFKEFSAKSEVKIKPTDFIVAEKLTKVLEKLWLIWENLEKAKKDLLLKMALREPEKETLQKTPVANALYDKIGEDGFWQKENGEKQNQMLNQIADLAHRANAGLDFLVLQNVLNKTTLDWTDLVEKFFQLAKALEDLNLVRKIVALDTLNKVWKSLSPTVPVQPVVNVNAKETESLEEIRIEKMLTQKEKIDFGARAQLVESSNMKNSGWKKNKSQDDLIREGYQQAEAQAQKHLYETLEKERKNLKNIHQKQKRFEEEEVEETPQKDRKSLYAGILTSGAIGGTFLLAYMLN